MSATDVGTPLLDVLVLGPVEVSGRDGPLVVRRPLERALATRLALARGVAVADDRLSRDLWGDADLARPAERLRVLASRLRTSLGRVGVALTRSGGGYALRAEPSDAVFAEAAVRVLHDALAAGDRDAARVAALDALGRWRGAALADLRSVPYLASEGRRLDALRLDLRVELLDLDLTAGASASAVTELDQLATEHPLHERVNRMLALALYRSGRQADALGVLGRLRYALGEEMGVDPAAETAALELGILRHDPVLSAAESTVTIPRQGVPEQPRLPKPRLPLPTTSFLGRHSERAVLCTELDAQGVVTLVGIAGSGKTRLALEVARVAPRPVVWFDLTPLRDPDELVPALATTVGVEPGLGADTVRRCAEALAGALLVMDNAEHVVEGVADLAATLSRYVDTLAVLVTSQRPLQISGERVHHVGPLSRADAGRLFCDRSGAAPGPEVDSICAALDSLPLAVELAAGLTRALSVRQVAERLDDRMRLLVGGSRDAGPRHTSLRAALDWSHALLERRSREVLRRVSVFAGGWRLEAAEQVAVGGDIEAVDVSIALADLVDRNLVTVAPGPYGNRFGLLETVRHYALDQLRAAHEEEGARDRHLAWCRAHVAAHDLEDPATTAEGKLDALFAEWPNLVRALACAPGTPRAADALRLALALDDAWVMRGLTSEIVEHYAALVDADGVSDVERAIALSNYGYACTQVGRTAQGVELLDRAARLAADVQDDELVMRVLYHRGIAELESGRPAEAFPPLRQGAGIAERLKRAVALSAFQSVLAMVHMYSGDLDASLRLHRETNQYDRARGDEHGLARGLVNEAVVLLLRGDVATAHRRADEAERIGNLLDDPITGLYVAMIRGRAHLAAGDYAGAADCFRRAIARAEDSADTDLLRIDLAEALLASGDLAGARELVGKALARFDEGLVWLVALPTAAAVALADRDRGRASALARRASDEYAERSFAWPHAVRRLDSVRAALGTR